jgi:hypothetical protein
MKRVVLIAGTINHHQDTEDTRYVHLDANPRNIYDAELNMMLAPDVVANLSDELPMFADGVFDEIRCHHVLEHMTFEQSTLAVNAMARVLKSGGTFDVETPDFDRIAAAWVNGDYKPKELQQWIYGEDLHGEYDGHRQALGSAALRRLVESAGLKIIEQPETGLACRFIARKP